MLNVFRWLMVVPGAVICAFLATFPLHIVLYQTLTGSGFVEPYPQLPERLLSPFVMATAFIWAGSRIAPHRKLETGVVLFGAWLLFAGVSLTLALTGTRVGNVQYTVQSGGLPFAGALIGAHLGLYLIYREVVSQRANAAEAQRN